jgi:carbonic anhydrase/acetyltransferase-like protein (isoleucine patch superfamily)
MTAVIDPTATIAPTAVITGDVTIGPGSVVLDGAVLTADHGPIVIGASTVVMEGAVLRASGRFPLTVGDHCLIGPHCSISGATIEDEVFVATGASIFPAARIGRGSEVRINGVVHLRTILPPKSTVPIGWVTVGDPAVILSPGDHDLIWAVQRELDFPGFVFGVDREAGDTMVRLTERYSRALAASIAARS